MAMNVLSLMLNAAAREGRFGYHHNCEKLEITHLCFADDLLIFLDGTEDSLRQVLRVLDDFKHLSGLAISPEKSTFYSARLSASEVSHISSSTGLTPDSLPVKYLGLPLHSKKLSLANCAPLLQKIKERISSWTARSLSFAGRLQLLSAVIGGIINFWTSSHILPKGCLKAINSMCGAFLWHGNLESGHHARVCWDDVVKSKEEGGLGLKDLLFWNKACSIKLIHLLFAKSGSLWVAWFIEHILQGDLSNYWTVKFKPQFSYQVTKLLKIRDAVKDWITLEVGNGQTCRFWTDSWSPFGRLIEFLHPQGPRQLGIPLSASLSSLYHQGSWRMAAARSENQVLLQIHLSSMSLSPSADKWIWSGPNPSQSSKITTGSIYNHIRPSHPTQSWTKLIWFNPGIPKHKLYTWLVLLDRLPTRDRLLRWGLSVPTNCLLCNSQPETRDHIFFHCSFSWRVWEPLATSLQISPSQDWNLSLTILKDLRIHKHRMKLVLIVWQATVYLLWAERNQRLHQQRFRPPQALLRQIDQIIRNRASSLRTSNPSLSSALLQLWFSLSESLNLHN